MKKKTIVYNFYGGPGIGKTTTAIKLYALLKSHYKQGELIHEFVKDWIWEDRKILDTDQIYILANQHRKERLLYGQVDFIITDSPMWLVPIYEKELSSPPFITKQIIDKYLKASPEVEHVHILLERFFPYDPVGRHQTEKEAIELDNKIKQFLIENNMKYETFPAKENCELDIAKKLKLI